MSETALPALMKDIGEALMLDNDNCEKEAYKKYVSCIYKISTNLILNIRATGGDVVLTAKTMRQVKLAQQCIDRIADISEQIVGFGCSPVTPTTSVSLTQQTILPITSKHSQGMEISSVPMVTFHQPPTLMSTDNNLQNSRQVQPVPSLPVEKNPHVYSISRALTPMEKAHRQNQSLMVAYKARMARLNKSDFSAFNYSLTIQRKMAENLAIAQAQEMELARKIEARNQRLEEQAAKRFASAAPLGMSEEEQEQRHTYKRILEYENEAKWLQNWRNKLEANPEDPILINQLVQEILRCSDHPVTELLRKLQFKVYGLLYPLVVDKHFELDKITVPLDQDMWPSPEEALEVLRTSQVLTQISWSKRDAARHPRSKKLFTRDSDLSKQEYKLDGSNSQRDSVDGASCDWTEPEPPKSKTQSEKSDHCVQDYPALENREERNDSCVHKCRSDSDLVIDSSDESSAAAVEYSDPLGVIVKDSEEDNGFVDLQIIDEKPSSQFCKSSKAANSVDNTEMKNVLQFLENDKHSVTKTGDDPDSTEDHDCEFHPSRKEKQLDTGDRGAETSEGKQEKSDRDSENRSDDTANEEEPECDVRSVVAQTKKDLNIAIAKGEALETQISWQRRQAQLLMQQVTQDYENYVEENFDDLFDDDDNTDEENDNSFARPVFGASCSPCYDKHYVLKTPEASIDVTDGPGFNSSMSDVLQANSYTTVRDEPHAFQSLPANISQQMLSIERKKLETLRKEAYRRHLKTIADDIHSYLEKLLVMMTIAYEPLDSPVGRDQCAVSMEEPFFKPIWKTLLRLFRVVNHQEEVVVASVMTRHANSSLHDMNVSKKFRLQELEGLEKPYQKAITQIVKIRDHYTMLNKLECVVKVCRLICECVDEYYLKFDHAAQKAGKKGPTMGADDLLPVLSYVVIQSAMPQLLSECNAMTEFIHEGYMMGEEGYCLTTLRTALNYIASLTSSPTSP